MGATGAGPAADGIGAPFVFGGSIEADAMSSSLEVAASSLWMRVVSASLGIIGTTLSSMTSLCNSPADVGYLERIYKATVPFDQSSQVMHIAGGHSCCRDLDARSSFQVTEVGLRN